MATLAQLKKYFENHPTCLQAATPLRENTRIGLDVASDHVIHSYVFTRKKNGNLIEPQQPLNPLPCDLTFVVPQEFMNSLMKFESQDIGEIGVFVLKHMTENISATKRIRLKVQAGPLSLMKNGYLGIFVLGGRSVAAFLALHGVSLFSFKKVLQRFRDST